MKDKFPAILFALLSILSMIGVWWIYPDGKTAVTATAADGTFAGPTRGKSERLSLTKPASPAVVGGSQAAIKTAAMREAFETAPNYAAFIHTAMQRPSEGGRFYAWLAYNRCDDISTTDVNSVQPSGLGEHHKRAISALSDLKARCAGVAGQFPDHSTFVRAVKSANAKGAKDILLIEGDAMSGPSAAGGWKALEFAKETGDPYLLAATLDANVESLAETIDPAYKGGRNRPTLFVASAAAACEIVGNCRHNVQLFLPCVIGGSCDHDDLRDSLRDSLDPEARKLYEKTRLALLKIAGK